MQDQDNCNNSLFCYWDQVDEYCRIKLNKINIKDKYLLNSKKSNNKTKYINKIADEIIRNKILSEQILNGKISENNDDSKYKILNENEKILYGIDIEENENIVDELYHIPNTSKRYVRFGELIKTFYNSAKNNNDTRIEKNLKEILRTRISRR